MSKKNTTIKDRILYFAENEEISKQEFFRKTNLNYSNFTGKSKESDLNSKSVAEILLTYPQINPYWLLSGNGEMLNPDYFASAKDNKQTGPIKNRLTDPYYLKITDLGLLLADNMKFLSFLVSILHENDYHFDTKENDTITFYRDLEKEYENIRLGVDLLNPDDFEKVQIIIRSELFSFINSMILKCSEVLNIKKAFYF